MRLLVATRSPGKLREIRAILSSVPGLHLVSLDDVGVLESPEEEAVEAFESFVGNAAAKADYFRRRTRIATIADDSGLIVDALGGHPGVRSRRFAPRSRDLRGTEQDLENNRYLIELLVAVPDEARSARYVCAAVLDSGNGAARAFEGRAEGWIAREPRGRGGFGYDPYFVDRDTGRTFAEMKPEEKDAKSHRGKAFRAMATHLREVAPGESGSLG